MIELPEATVLAKQIDGTVAGKRIKKVTAAKSPHEFAWYYGDPKEYHGLLVGKAIGTAVSYGGFVEIPASDATLLFLQANHGNLLGHHNTKQTYAGF